MKLLIDTDITLFQVCQQSEVEIDWGDDTWTLETDLREAKDRFVKKIKQYQELTGIKEFLLIISDRENFRKDINSTYKENRKDTRKPLGYKAMKEWVLENYPCDTRPKLEADDLIAWYMTKYPGEYQIVSMDKDFMQVPGRFFRISPKGEHKLHEITPEAANKFLMTQIIMGDATDGYYGIPGIGPKKAEAWLEKHGYNFESVVKMYEANGMTRQDAVMEARMARLLTADEYVDGKVKLWNPK